MIYILFKLHLPHLSNNIHILITHFIYRYTHWDIKLKNINYLLLIILFEYKKNQMIKLKLHV